MAGVGGQDPGGADGEVGTGGVEELGMVNEQIEGPDGAGAVAGDGDVGDGEVGEEGGDDLWSV